jgi:release factor glutamine methyltransferase
MRLFPLPGVFRPPSDSWLLAEYVRRERLAAGAAVLDLCSGSGVLAIAAACDEAAHVTAVDVSRRAVAAVRLNGWVNGVRVEGVRGDLFEPVRSRRFDLIVTNPPYLPGDVSRLPQRGLARAWEGGRSGRVFIERIACGAQDHLTPNGVLLIVCSTVCGEEQILDELTRSGLRPDVVVRSRGPLGPRLTARADWLRRQGLLLDGDQEEILVVRAGLATPAGSASPSRGHPRSTSSRGPAPGRSAPARAAAS